MKQPGAWRRWVKFNAVGAMGFAVQIGGLAALHGAAGIGLMASTAISVELAVLHNFIWHERWTWRDPERPSGGGGALRRLLRFNLTTGLVSLATNLALMRLLVSVLHTPYLAANLACVGAGALANYFLNDRFVFAEAKVSVMPTPSPDSRAA